MLRADVVLVFSDVVQQTAVGHQLGDKLDGGGQADAEQTTHVRMLNARHHIGLLQIQTNEVSIYIVYSNNDKYCRCL